MDMWRVHQLGVIPRYDRDTRAAVVPFASIIALALHENSLRKPASQAMAAPQQRTQQQATSWALSDASTASHLVLCMQTEDARRRVGTLVPAWLPHLVSLSHRLQRIALNLNGKWASGRLRLPDHQHQRWLPLQRRNVKNDAVDSLLLCTGGHTARAGGHLASCRCCLALRYGTLDTGLSVAACASIARSHLPPHHSCCNCVARAACVHHRRLANCNWHALRGCASSSSLAASASAMST
ncbi:hypothetical protein JKP88DRAFT_251307 [Tribonema minus]|uniref:Uncharacterized protein n=1 Tax=Tribonema minus TaxID=303371 RepID=A0A835ZGF7_9STRA|nr:hypothetical protein JKP88DRAFT_251307 [Tribonema minus]